jgi:hypothetical protein
LNIGVTRVLNWNSSSSVRLIYEECPPYDSSKLPHHWNHLNFSSSLSNWAISSSLVWKLNAIVSRYQKVGFLVGSQIDFRGVFSSTTSIGHFSVTYENSDFMCLIMSSNFPCFPLWKVATSSWLVLINASSLYAFKGSTNLPFYHLLLLFFLHAPSDNSHHPPT